MTTAPSGDVLTVRDNGHKVRGVSDVRTGERLPFVQKGGRLTISGVPAWDPYDTVLRVKRTARARGYPRRSITSTASAADGRATRPPASPTAPS